MKFKGNTKYLLIAIAIGLMGGLVSCDGGKPPVPLPLVTELTISSPAKDADIKDSPLKVEGIVRTTDPTAFSSRYAICLYKDIDSSVYWQKDCGNVTIAGEKWQGEVWPQDSGFSNNAISKGFKDEGIIAVVYQSGKTLPGDGNSSQKISKIELQNSLPKNIGINMSLTQTYKNKLPSQAK